jgi:hypothetical protein
MVLHQAPRQNHVSFIGEMALAVNLEGRLGWRNAKAPRFGSVGRLRLSGRASTIGPRQVMGRSVQGNAMALKILSIGEEIDGEVHISARFDDCEFICALRLGDVLQCLGSDYVPTVNLRANIVPHLDIFTKACEAAAVGNRPLHKGDRIVLQASYAS